MEVMYVSFAEAQRLIPILKHVAKYGPYKEAKESAKRILQELELVRRDISYDPLAGRQVILRSENDRDFLRDAIEATREQGEV